MNFRNQADGFAGNHQRVERMMSAEDRAARDALKPLILQALQVNHGFFWCVDLFEVIKQKVIRVEVSMYMAAVLSMWRDDKTLEMHSADAGPKHEGNSTLLSVSGPPVPVDTCSQCSEFPCVCNVSGLLLTSAQLIGSRSFVTITDKGQQNA